MLNKLLDFQEIEIFHKEDRKVDNPEILEILNNYLNEHEQVTKEEKQTAISDFVSGKTNENHCKQHIDMIAEDADDDPAGLICDSYKAYIKPDIMEYA